MSEEIVQISFQIISCSGTAKSMYIEAIQKVKEKEYEIANELIQEAEEIFVEAHKTHAKLVQSEAQGITTEVSLLLIHAEDQMAACETIKLLAQETMEVYKLLHRYIG